MIPEKKIEEITKIITGSCANPISLQTRVTEELVKAYIRSLAREHDNAIVAVDFCAALGVALGNVLVQASWLGEDQSPEGRTRTVNFMLRNVIEVLKMALADGMGEIVALQNFETGEITPVHKGDPNGRTN